MKSIIALALVVFDAPRVLALNPDPLCGDEGTGVSSTHAQQLTQITQQVYQVCDKINNPKYFGLAIAEALREGGNSSFFLNMMCGNACEREFRVWANAPGWAECAPQVRAKDFNYRLASMVNKCPKREDDDSKSKTLTTQSPSCEECNRLALQERKDCCAKEADSCFWNKVTAPGIGVRESCLAKRREDITIVV